MIHTMSSVNCKNESRHSSSKCLSPIALVDPKVRALNTIMYGLLIHFGSWSLFGTGSSSNGSAITDACETNVNDWYWLRSTLLLHEYWVYLQHTNVLANPYCQRLDRQYGIALLKSNQHWAIAGTLSVRVYAKTNGNFHCLSFIPPIQPSHKYESLATPQRPIGVENRLECFFVCHIYRAKMLGSLATSFSIL